MYESDENDSYMYSDNNKNSVSSIDEHRQNIEETEAYFLEILEEACEEVDDPEDVNELYYAICRIAESEGKRCYLALNEDEAYDALLWVLENY
jgi:hypothetical protein